MSKELNQALARAIAFASEVHVDHLDRGGQPYILHPMRIMNAIRSKFPNDLRAQIVAVCHDTIEDGWPDNFEMGFEVFNSEVIADVEVNHILSLLTHKKEVDYFEYIKNIKVHPVATAVKIADLTDNSDITRLKGLKDKDFDRLKKYHKSYCYLTGQSEFLLDLK